MLVSVAAGGLVTHSGPRHPHADCDAAISILIDFFRAGDVSSGLSVDLKRPSVLLWRAKSVHIAAHFARTAPASRGKRS